MRSFLAGAGQARGYLLINMVFAGMIILIIIYSGVFSPVRNDYPVQCLHEKITGKPCPSCGLSHSFSYMLRGRIAEAIEWNTYGPRVFLFFILQLVMRVSFSFTLLRNPGSARKLAIIDVLVSVTAFSLAFSQFVSYWFSSVSGSFNISSISL